MIAFTKVKLPYGWLSNMSPHPVGGYRTAEALFQACRFADQAIRTEIGDQLSPMGAKMVARKHAAKMDVVPRSAQDLALMKMVLEMKLQCHPHLKAELLATGDEEIIEDVTNRPNESGLYWGKIPGGKGENALGKIWMQIRAELRAK